MDSPRTSSDADGDDDSADLLGRNHLHSLSDAITQRSHSSSVGDSEAAVMSATDPRKSLKSEPSTSSSQGVLPKVSPLRALVRTLTPKRRPKPILVKAGFHREPVEGEDEDLHVTFDIPRNSTDITAADSSNTNLVTNPLRSCRRCCDKPLVAVAGILSLIGGMSFGYDIGIISGMMQPIREKFHLTCSQEQVLVGCLIGGALIVSICGGPWIDKCGRRRAILISCTVFILGTGLSSIAPSLDTLSAGRLLQGFGMSMAAISECIYISEIAPKDKRGLMVGLNELGITLGFVMAFFFGYILHGVKDSWRIMMGIGAGPAAIQLIGTFFFLPPSPREKMMNKCDKEAILILDNLRGSRNEAMNEFASIRHALIIEESYGTLSLFKSSDNMLFRLLVGFSLVLLQQISGQPNVMYYAAVVFEQVGFSVRWASLATLGLGVVKVIATAVALCITDKKGRRFFLVLGCLLMACSIAVVGISTLIHPPSIPKPCQRNFTESVHPFQSAQTAEFAAFSSHSQNSSRQYSQVVSNTTTLSALVEGPHVAQLIVNFLALVVYVIGYSVGFGPMTWLVLSELYPSGIKGRAMSFCNIINWVASLAMSLSFLHTMTTFTIGGTFIIFSVLNFFSALYIFLVVPETEGKSLEKISYELRTIRPKQRFDSNFQRLCPCLKFRLNRPGLGHDYSRVDRHALL